jgi:hypothetical protein
MAVTSTLRAAVIENRLGESTDRPNVSYLREGDTFAVAALSETGRCYLAVDNEEGTKLFWSSTLPECRATNNATSSVWNFVPEAV